MREILEKLRRQNRFDLQEFTDGLVEKYSEKIYKNSDYYAFLVHLCQKKQYSMNGRGKQETFLDGIIEEYFTPEDNARYGGQEFNIVMGSEGELIELVIAGMQVVNIIFERAGE